MLYDEFYCSVNFLKIEQPPDNQNLFKSFHFLESTN